MLNLREDEPMKSMSRRILLASVAALCAAAPAAQAETAFPTKPVTMIVAASAGAGPDVLALLVADRLSQRWGQQITVMNKTGNYGTASLQAVTSTPADGHTLVVSIASSFIVWPEIQKAAAIELQREITPVGLLGVQPMVIAVHPGTGAGTLADLVAATERRPDEILYGGFRATIPHLTGARLANAGFRWRFIPSQAPRAVQDAMGGSLHVAIESVAALAPPMNAGLLKGLAVMSSSRLPELPDLPTVGEAIPALAGVEANGWVALVARAGTPEPIIQKINSDLRAVLAEPDMTRRLATLGTYPRLVTPADTALFIQGEKDRWRPVVQSLDLATQ
jgi:tripartite-type tricarboxylate transporter receptor subunit TctC